MKRIRTGLRLRWVLAGILCATLPGLLGCEDNDKKSSAEPTVVTNVVVVGNKTNVVVITNAPAPPAPLNVAGKWNGPVTQNGVTRHLVLTLTQSGEAIGGSFTFDTGLKGSAGGSIAGDHLVLKLLPTAALSPDFHTVFDGHVNASATAYLGQTTSKPDGKKGEFALQK